MAVNTRDDFYRNIAKGKGLILPYRAGGAGTTTAGAAASGNFTVQMLFNLATVTQPGTLTSILLPPGLSADAMVSLVVNNIAASSRRGVYLAYFYRIGTLSLTAINNQFTHDAATFPVTRTQFGAATKALSLLPLIYVTTATSTTAPAFKLQTVTPTAGYTNQAGTAVTGSKLFTFPAAATAVDTTLVLRLEEGDSGIQDMTQINVITASSTGAATIFGAELLAPLGTVVAAANFAHDGLLGGLNLPDLRPASATSGSLTSFLGLLSFNSTLAASAEGLLQLALSA